MRLTTSVLLHKHTTIQDIYGGESVGTTTTTTLPALVSISNDDFKPLPSGFGYYRKLTALVPSTATIAKGDYVEVDNVEYHITKASAYSTFHTLLVGYEA